MVSWFKKPAMSVEPDAFLVRVFDRKRGWQNRTAQNLLISVGKRYGVPRDNVVPVVYREEEGFQGRDSMAKPVFNRILYKISGEALMGGQGFGIDPQMVSHIVDDIVEARDLGVSMALVVGGGNIFRGVALASKGSDRVTGDHMGMLAIVMNALSLRMEFDKRGVGCTVLSGLAVPQVCESFTQRGMIAARDRGDIIIFAGGTGSPYFTSDTGAALRASEFGADAILKGTQVDGVYSADPKKDPNAVRYDELSHDDLLEKKLAIMDASAVALARDNAIDLVVFSLHQKGELARVIAGQGTFTRVLSTQG